MNDQTKKRQRRKHRRLADCSQEELRQIAECVAPEAAEAEIRVLAAHLFEQLAGRIYTKLLRGAPLRLDEMVDEFATWFGSLATRGERSYDPARCHYAMVCMETAIEVRRTIEFLRAELPRNHDWNVALSNAGFGPDQVERALKAIRGSTSEATPRLSKILASNYANAAVTAARGWSAESTRVKRLCDVALAVPRVRKQLSSARMRHRFIVRAKAAYHQSLQYGVRAKLEREALRAGALRRRRRRRPREITVEKAIKVLLSEPNDWDPRQRARSGASPADSARSSTQQSRTSGLSWRP